MRHGLCGASRSIAVVQAQATCQGPLDGPAWEEGLTTCAHASGLGGSGASSLLEPLIAKGLLKARGITREELWNENLGGHLEAAGGVVAVLALVAVLEVSAPCHAPSSHHTPPLFTQISIYCKRYIQIYYKRYFQFIARYTFKVHQMSTVPVTNRRLLLLHHYFHDEHVRKPLC